jgi:hypothetical protein
LDEIVAVFINSWAPEFQIKDSFKISLVYGWLRTLMCYVLLRSSLDLRVLALRHFPPEFSIVAICAEAECNAKTYIKKKMFGELVFMVPD